MILLPLSIDANLDRAITMIAKSTAGSFVATFTALEGKKKRQGRYVVSYARPDALTLRSTLGETDRTFSIVGTQLRAWDHVAREYLETTVKGKGTALERMAGAVPVDEPIRILVDPGVGKNFLSTFRALEGWTATRGAWVARDGKGKFTLAFDASGRLKSFRADSPSGWIAWAYTYGPKPERPPTTGFRKVDAFYDPTDASSGLPTYQDAAARSITERAIKAYNRLRQVAFRVDDGSQVTDVWLDAPNLRQRTPRADFSLIGGKLWFRVDGRWLASGRKATLRETDEMVGKSGAPLDPFLSKLARRQNPLFSLLGPDLKARRVGSLATGKLACDVLEFKGPGIRMTWTVRRDNGLLHAVSSEVLDSRGRVLAKSERRYDYRSVGKPLGLVAPN